MKKLFDILKIDEAKAIKLAVEPDELHSHDFEELIIGIKGELESFIDYSATKTKAPFVSFITKGKVHRIIPRTYEGECDIWIIRFKSEFIPETTFQLYSLYHDNANLNLESGSCFHRLEKLCEMMNDETLQENPSFAIIKQLLSTLFTMIEVDREKFGTKNEKLQKTQNISFGNFLSILEENYRKPLGVDFYAEKLFMSTRNLNLICQNILEQSVLEIIETRKLIEAKNLLISSEKTIAEIAYELGYNENSYFSNVFKKKSGQSPSEFREEMRVILTS